MEKLKHSSLSSQFHFREDLEAVLHDVFSHAYEKGDRGEKNRKKLENIKHSFPVKIQKFTFAGRERKIQIPFSSAQLLISAARYVWWLTFFITLQ